MDDWVVNEQKQPEFAGGKENWEKAAQMAARCEEFLVDDEDEMVAEEDRSCYNCRLRRWTVNSFVCMRQRHQNG